MFRVFLSFHSFDRAIALGLKRAIESSLPGADVFVDQTTLRHGHLWQPSLFDAIAKAQAFLVLVSTQIGDWQKVEYYEARDRKARDDAFVLLPIIIADRTKGPAANLPGLTQLHWIEATEPTAPEPLARIIAALQTRDVPRPSEPWRAINPYRGLMTLQEQDVDFFFGRDRETAEIIGRIVTMPGRLVTLVGNSGVGKSSLVQAGVIGSLKRQRWPGEQREWPQVLRNSRAWAYLGMKPGEDPIDALMSEFTALWYPDPTNPRHVDRRCEWVQRLREGKALLEDVVKATDEHLRSELSLTPPPRIFVYIDQGEELYTRTPLTERKRFSQIIAGWLARNPRRVAVMTSLRADHYGALQANAELFKLSEKIDVPPLDADNLERVLREPARALGVGFESDDLVRHVVKSAEDQPGSLPLLADLFTDLWKRMQDRGDGILRVSDRLEIIQVGAALSRRADQFLAQAPDKVNAVKRLFTLRLTHLPRQGEPARVRWQRKSEGGIDLDEDAEWTLVEQLARSEWRLLVTGEKDGNPTAEVAHEVLLKSWTTLSRWLKEEREFLVWRGELSARREEYEQDRKAGSLALQQALLMGRPLDLAKKWLAARRNDIESADRAFIDASVRAEWASSRKRTLLQWAVGTLTLCVIVGLVGWSEQRWLLERWRWFAVVRPYMQTQVRPYVLSTEAERSLEPGNSFKECKKDCPEMIVVPAGHFTMGSPPTEEGHYRDESPQHSVDFKQPFAVSRFAVTFADWSACVSVGGCPQEGRPADLGWSGGLQPMIMVSWNDAQSYVRWLSNMTNRPYRLLTEAEYEYAARAGATTPYPWGSDIKSGGKAMANCKGCGSEWDNRRAAVVGSFEPNAFGLYDMVGNVFSWVADCYHKTYDDAPQNGSAWITADCDERVRRGGSWSRLPLLLRSAFRNHGASSDRPNDLGFRVGRTLYAGATATTVSSEH